MSKRSKKSYSAKLKFQVVLEALISDKEDAEVARAYLACQIGSNFGSQIPSKWHLRCDLITDWSCMSLAVWSLPASYLLFTFHSRI